MRPSWYGVKGSCRRGAAFALLEHSDPRAMADLDDLAQQFRDVRIRAAALVAPLSEAQFNWRARPGSFSVAECLVHLNVTADAVLARMLRAIAGGRRRGLTGSGPFRYGWFSRWFEAGMEPPPKRRSRSPGVFAITAGSSYHKEDVMREFAAEGENWLEALQLARGLDLRRVKTASPASRFLRFPIGAYFRISVAHERRHLWQAEQVVRQPGFPAGET